MSGNGYHLYYALDEGALEPTAENRAIREAVLKGLARIFDNSSCKIDRGVANESRLTKVIGSVAYRG